MPERVKHETSTENIQKDEFNSLVNEVLEPIYKIIRRFIPASIKDTPAIWSLTSLFFLILLIKTKWFSEDGFLVIIPVLFVLEVLYANIEKLRIRPKREEIDSFLRDLSKMNMIGVLYFIEINERKLSYDDVVKILSSRYRKHQELYKKIARFQNFTSELLEYFVENNLTQYITDDVLVLFIERCSTSLDKQTFLKLYDENRSPRIKASLLLSNPGFIKHETGAAQIWLIKHCGDLIGMLRIPQIVSLFSMFLGAISIVLMIPPSPEQRSENIVAMTLLMIIFAFFFYFLLGVIRKVITEVSYHLLSSRQVITTIKLR